MAETSSVPFDVTGPMLGTRIWSADEWQYGGEISKKGSRVSKNSSAYLKEKMGPLPEQFSRPQGLNGDKSDNIQVAE